MFEIPIDNLYFSEYIYIKEFRDVFLLGTEVLHMSNKEYKRYIIEMLDMIDDNEHLKRIVNYVHKFFIRKAGK